MPPPPPLSAACKLLPYELFLSTMATEGGGGLRGSAADGKTAAAAETAREGVEAIGQRGVEEEEGSIGGGSQGFLWWEESRG